MPSSFLYCDINEALPHMMRAVIAGSETHSRNGTVRELRMVQTTFTRPGNGYLTNPERKASLPAQIAETMWLLAGRNDVEWLQNYLPRAAEFSDDGKVWRGGYGPRIRQWYAGEAPQQSGSCTVDQLAHVVELLTADRTTRRAVINIYDPAVDTNPGKDIPCNNWLHFLPRGGRLDLHVAIRSNDLMWGFSGINHFEWTQLLNIVSSLADLLPGSITFSASSLHLYEPYWPKANRIGCTKGGTPLAPAPKFGQAARTVKQLDKYIVQWFTLEARIREGRADADTAAEMTEPLFRSWLHALYSWHTGKALPAYLHGTDLEAALNCSPKRKQPEPEAGAQAEAPALPNFPERSFPAFVAQLHADKHAAYGESWMRRGEQMGIMANIARKVDRLGVSGGGDTSADTAIDLLAYLIKYELWLTYQYRDSTVALTGPEHVVAFNEKLTYLHTAGRVLRSNGYYVLLSKRRFDDLERSVTEAAGYEEKWELVQSLLACAYPLAQRLWRAESNATRSWNPEAGA